MRKDEFFKDARDDLTGPLAGVKVLEITSTWAGPMCGVVLADLGAEVVKVEIPTGDVARSIMALPDSEVSVMHATVNRNKRSLAIDMTKPEGKQVLLDLAAESDILLENFKSGVLARHGLGYDDVRSVKPDIIYVSVTGWGQFGPNHEAAGYDPLAQATSGFMTVNGSPDGPPTKSGSFLADDLGGLHGAIGAMAALRHRDQTGEGQYVDIALLDSMLYQTDGMPTLGAIGVQPDRWGNEFGFAVPADVYQCTDGPVYCGVLLDDHWKRLAVIIGQPELAENEAFVNVEGRAQNRDVCNMLLGGWLGERTRDEAIEVLREAGLAIAKVQSFIDVVEDEHVQERDMLQPVTHHDGTTVPIVGPSWKFSRTPVKIRTPAPSLGQDTDAILEGLGLTDDQVAGLRDAGIVP